MRRLWWRIDDVMASQVVWWTAVAVISMAILGSCAYHIIVETEVTHCESGFDVVAAGECERLSPRDVRPY